MNSGVDTGEMLSDIVEFLVVPSTEDLEAMKGGDSFLVDSLKLLQGGILPSEGHVKQQIKVEPRKQHCCMKGANCKGECSYIFNQT